MSFDPVKLSAYLDGELSAVETAEIETALQQDQALQGELEMLIQGQEIGLADLNAALESPVPEDLIAAIETAPVPEVANSPLPPQRFAVVAATVLAAFVGVSGGYFLGASQPNTQVASVAGGEVLPEWVSDVADYHRVYAEEGRHLVEVGADEQEHLETWLTKVVGAEVIAPDLSHHGLTFEGGRLLVAAGKPVAQLMYTDATQRVVALCLLQTDTPATQVETRSLHEFEMVTWGDTNRNFIVIGDEDRQDLGAIAETVAQEV
ncbi:anti-sigma factor family protein [Epibacterium ulvae]|uniref:anti-sigma factor family protein n=1 Tax=Epibacterium ulvae TaxID=1156985 RepID=UPI0024930A7C|nr:anti-sigma factor [Epibacterium ulvae]